MTVNFIGFGGLGIEYPCYEDEKGKIYFDLNDGKGELNLYTGGYKKDEDIYGEPCSPVKEKVKCNNPFKRNRQEFEYMMLDRLKSDCEYFFQNENEKDLYYHNIKERINEMKRLYEVLIEKPEWLTLEQIEDYEKRMLQEIKKEE